MNSHNNITHPPDLFVWFVGRSWDALRAAMPCQALVVVYNNRTALQAGVANRQSGTEAARKVDPLSLMAGSICTTVKSTGRGGVSPPFFLFISAHSDVHRGW